MFKRKQGSGQFLTIMIPALILILLQACQDTPAPPTTTEKPALVQNETATLTPAPTRTPTPEPVTWNYVAFGDQSIIADDGALSYATHFASFFAEDLGVNVEVAFYTTADVLVKDQLDRLRNDPELRTAIQNAQVVTIATGDLDIIYPVISSYLWDSCGGEDNEACIREALTDFRTSFDSLLAEILKLCKPGTIVRTMTLYTRSLHALYGSDEDLQPFYLPLNAHILEAASLHDIPVARVHEAFGNAEEAVANGYLNAAGWNPTTAGAQLIADLHRELGYEATCP